ncbi:MAG: DUF2125 domain-containing protein [Pseudomonadota bacterium]
MSRISRLTCGTALALCLPASAALAELTAAQVWEDWQAYMASSGYDVTATETAAAGSLTVSDATLSMAMGEAPEDGTVRLVMDQLRFVENADGSVSIEVPADMRFDLDLATEEGEDLDMAIAVTQDAPVMTASGTPEAITYDYTTPSVVMEMVDLMIDGTPVGSEVAAVSVALDTVSNTSKMTLGDLRRVDQSMQVGAVRYDVRFEDPEGEGAVKLSGTAQNLVFDGEAALPEVDDPQDMNAMLTAGFGFDGSYANGGGSFDLTFDGPDGSGTANGTTQGTQAQIAMGDAGLIYDVLQQGMALNLLLTEFPLPMSFAASEVGTSFQMPLQKSPEPQPFGMGLSFGDFTMSDVIWGLFDPQGQLPRDPATIAVDLSGQAKVLFDFLDPAQAEVLEATGAMPGELNALTLNQLEVDAVGAKLTGVGDFTFDNSDLTTFDGFPKPLGTMDLQLTGGNTLLDTLVGMGLVPQDQAMGARMMMGLFAVPGDGPDTLNSRIEVNEEGQVLANGQRIR